MAILHCDYDLENSELYSIKFYKDYVEFYRYLPREEFPKQSFNLDGIHLDTTKSNATHVILYLTDLNSDGLYGCEVSTEGWPPLQLNWFINDSPAPNEYLISSKPSVDPNGLVQTNLTLSFKADREFFQHDNLRIRCAASLMFIYELKTIEYLIDGSKPKRSSSYRRYSTAQINSKEMPKISGVRDKYNVNDVANLNCSTTIPNAQLSWFINGRKANGSNLIVHRGVRNRKEETILGIRFVMEKKYFQTEEMELQCTAYYIKTIADFQEQAIIRTFNSEFLLSHSSSCSSVWQKFDLICSIVIFRLIFLFPVQNLFYSLSLIYDLVDGCKFTLSD
ncbi:hypothetical protein QR98_0012550 [Sarcoptes scabiei]|uniref:Ig-like domain-containing protein n=1 Tax=Sarcoptes scabiei TaxID=52283 RepID=A0A131ZVH7_SARSC|nr:hypothetical protein QR98_0012550 [Sarcoptes scabiei]